MRATPGITIDDTNIVSQTVAEPSPGETAYNVNSVYRLDNEVISVATHRVYKSLSGDASVVTFDLTGETVVSTAFPAAATPVIFETTGALPTGLTAGTTYYVINPLAGSYQVAATPGGSAILLSGSPSGTNTAILNPNKGRALTDPAWWYDDRPVNRLALFDLLRSTGTTGDSPMTYVIDPGVRVDSIGVLGITATGIEITVEAGSPLAEVYNYTADLNSRIVTSRYEYYTVPFTNQRSVVRHDLPPYISARITITLTSTAPVIVGSILLGRAHYVGEAQPQAESDTLNFSVIERNQFGEATLTPRRNIPKVNITTHIDQQYVPAMLELRDTLNAVPALWTGLDDEESDHGYFEAVLIQGIYRRWTIGMDNATYASQNFELEEV